MGEAAAKDHSRIAKFIAATILSRKDEANMDAPTPSPQAPDRAPRI
jgi:hypothetical protein